MSLKRNRARLRGRNIRAAQLFQPAGVHSKISPKEPPRCRPAAGTPTPAFPTLGNMDWEKGKETFEREFIIHALKSNHGRINMTAEQANIPKNTLLRKIKKYNINPREYGATDSDLA